MDAAGVEVAALVDVAEEVAVVVAVVVVAEVVVEAEKNTDYPFLILTLLLAHSHHCLQLLRQPYPQNLADILHFRNCLQSKKESASHAIHEFQYVLPSSMILCKTFHSKHLQGPLGGYLIDIVVHLEFLACLERSNRARPVVVEVQYSRESLRYVPRAPNFISLTSPAIHCFCRSLDYMYNFSEFR